MIAFTAHLLDRRGSVVCVHAHQHVTDVKTAFRGLDELAWGNRRPLVATELRKYAVRIDLACFINACWCVAGSSLRVALSTSKLLLGTNKETGLVSEGPASARHRARGGMLGR